MNTYIDFPYKNTAIAVESAEYEPGVIIPEHTHAFQEFVLITKGACMHQFRGIEMPLIAGDVFLVPSHQLHSYMMNSQIRFINCYFFPEQLGDDWEQLIREVLPSDTASGHLTTLHSQWTNLLTNLTPISNAQQTALAENEKSHVQGIIHLNPQETHRVESLLMQIDEEQHMNQFGSEYIKAALLQVILVTIKRAQDRQPQVQFPHSSHRRELIERALAYIDEHYQDELNVPQLARTSALSESYFRMLFKDITGLTPLEYVTRIRIIKSLEFLQRGGVTIRQAAELVGIYDPNYFTRLFKKIMGYPPRYFKKKRFDY